MRRASIPSPDADALAVCDALTSKIESAIDAAGGWLSFERFMQMALYEPGLGYYSAGAAKIGPAGDFTTAPEQGDWLAAALAGWLEGEFAALGSARLLELGGGTGALAERLLEQLALRGIDTVDYRILEPSADLRDRQRARLSGRWPAVSWLDRLPEAGFSGIVLANEVADAIPVARFVRGPDGVLPLGVVRASDVKASARGEGQDEGRVAGRSPGRDSHAKRLELEPGAPDAAVTAAVVAIELARGAALPAGYRSEVCLGLGPWLAAVLGAIETGGLLLIDYGLPQRDYYRDERADGTLICHYRQRAHADALLWPGLQDISAWVDFTAVATAARASGFDLAGFTTQAQFLLERIARDPRLQAAPPSPQAASALKTLVLPGEMGERFKLLWLTRGFAGPPLPGRDFRSWLDAG